MKKCFDFPNISLFNEERWIYLNLNLSFVKGHYGAFNKLKFLINSFLKKYKI